MRAIDLFCGTGGFSRGAHAAGFNVAAAYDIDPNLTYSYSRNFPDTKLVLTDISRLSAEAIQGHVGEGQIDLVFGGPPCQGFSAIGRRDAYDPRRSLLGNFFRLVSEIRPAVFVMENVEGLLFADARHVLDEALDHVADYVVLPPKVLNAAEFGAATTRRRTFVIGFDTELCSPFDWDEFEGARASAVTVEDAIRDLADPISVGNDANGFDHWQIRENAHVAPYAQHLMRSDRTFTGNKRTKHLPRVVERFANVAQGGVDPVGRYPRLAWDRQCPTLRAGTGADHGSHQAVRPLHPEENRVITVREAARLQGFPDEHQFHPTIWHSFRQIGNSVSPIIAEALLTILYNKLEEDAFAEAAE